MSVFEDNILDEMATTLSGLPIPEETIESANATRVKHGLPPIARETTKAAVLGMEYGGAEQSAPRTQEAAGVMGQRVDRSMLRLLPEGHIAMPAVEGYDVLAMVLGDAYLQAATGKGKERHSVGPLGFQPWHMQPIMQMGRMVGAGGHAYQIQKKAQESVTMAGNKNWKGAKAEALGAIVYAAALYRLYQEQEAANGGSS